MPVVFLEADLGTLRLWLILNYTVYTHTAHTYGQSVQSLSQRQGRVWSRLVPWGQLISFPAYTSASEWSSASFYCCSATVRKLLEVLEIWKWLIYLDKSHFPLRKEACVLPLDWSKCRFVHAEASFLSITEPHWNWWNPVTLKHCFTVSLLQHLDIVVVTQREGYIMPVRISLPVPKEPQETLCVPTPMWSGPGVTVYRGECYSVGGTSC